MKLLDFVIFLLLLVILGFSGFILWENLPGQTQEYNPKIRDKLAESETFNASSQFYPNMRYRSREISYHIEEVCGSKKKTDVEKSFSKLGNLTILRFYETKISPEMRILCSSMPPESESASHFIAGEGGPTEIVNTSKYYVILSGKVSLYRNEKCSEPHVALHEILHALGFDHNANKNSIMYQVANCEQELDKYIIEDINSIYLSPLIPDLVIENIIANKTGKYLSFSAAVTNKGLADAKNATLEIYSSGQKIKEFALEDIGIGIKKSLSVENLRVSKDSTNLKFIARAYNGEELFEADNEFELFIL